VIDLHAHSSASDGALAPAALVGAWARAGVTTLAITDHDTLEGLAPARAAADALGVRFLTGVELSTTDEAGRNWHILGYLFDPDSPTLAAFVRGIREARDVRNAEILARLAARGMPLDPAALAREAEGVIGRPHIARALVRAGHVASMEEAFERYLGDGCVCAVEARGVRPRDAAEAVHAAGGVAILAHPLGLGRSPDQAKRTLLAAHAAGLDGVEAHYGGHSAGEVKMLLSLVRQHGGLVSGGSDGHGRERPRADRGPRTEGLTPPDALAALEARAAEWRRRAS
jgi:predicted metal-dependent phosphoesterase TrpH